MQYKREELSRKYLQSSSSFLALFSQEKYEILAQIIDALYERSRVERLLEQIQEIIGCIEEAEKRPRESWQLNVQLRLAGDLDFIAALE